MRPTLSYSVSHLSRNSRFVRCSAFEELLVSHSIVEQNESSLKPKIGNCINRRQQHYVMCRNIHSARLRCSFINDRKRRSPAMLFPSVHAQQQQQLTDMDTRCARVRETYSHLPFITITVTMMSSSSYSLLWQRNSKLTSDIASALLLYPPCERTEWRRYCFCSVDVCMCVSVCASYGLQI